MDDQEQHTGTVLWFNPESDGAGMIEDDAGGPHCSFTRVDSLVYYRDLVKGDRVTFRRQGVFAIYVDLL